MKTTWIIRFGKTAGLAACFLFSAAAFADDPTATPTPCMDDPIGIDRDLPDELIPYQSFIVKLVPHGSCERIARFAETVPEGIIIVGPAWDAREGSTYIWNKYIPYYTAAHEFGSVPICFLGEFWAPICGETYHGYLDGDFCATFASGPETPVPTPTPTCLPCIPQIISRIQNIDDTTGDCSDADFRMDAGETVTMTVQFALEGMACTSETHSADIFSDNPHVAVSPEHINLDQTGFAVDLILKIDSSTECGEELNLTIETRALYCGHFYEYKNEHFLLLETDWSGETWECDLTPCEDPAHELPDLGIQLDMPDRDLTAGDDLKLTGTVWNRTGNDVFMDIYIVLGLEDHYWFYPSWEPLETGTDCLDFFQVDAWTDRSIPVLDFTWPHGLGIGDDLFFYGLALNAGSLEILGDLQIIEWRYR